MQPLVAVFLHPPLPAIELSYITEVFGNGRLSADEPYELAFGALQAGSVSSAAGITVLTPHGLELFDRAQIVIVPSWDPSAEVPPELVAALRTAHSRRARIVSIGSGVFALAAAGLLDDKRATTHWVHCQELADRYPKIRVEPDQLYIDEGDLITGAGRSAGLDMLLYLVGQDRGAAKCNEIAQRLIAPPYRAGHQTQRAARPVPRSKDNRLSGVIDYLRANATQPHRTPELAALAAMSPRTFNRKFRETVGQSPYNWLLQERIIIAKELLEMGGLSIDEVGAEAGFNSTQSFRKAFRSVTGINPTDYRRHRKEPEPARP